MKSPITLSIISTVIAIIICAFVYSDRFGTTVRTPSPEKVSTKTSSEKLRSHNGTGNEVPELVTYDPKKASPGFTLIPLVGNGKVLLVDMKGRTVHEWPIDASRARLLPDLHLLVVHGSKWGKRVKPWSKLRDFIIEYDAEGKEVWRYRAPDHTHHDVHRLQNGNTLVLYRDLLDRTVGEVFDNEKRMKQSIRSDAIQEVTPEGEVVWSWRLAEHIDPTYYGRRPHGPEDGKVTAEYDWTHVNTVSKLPENRWYDAGHKEFRPGNLLISPRSFWEIMIIDSETQKVVWTYGGDYKGGLEASHEPRMIPKGYPGEGNILIFDNGVLNHKGESFILEIDPVSKKIVWMYDQGQEFHSGRRGAVQRLPNGNTLISEDERNRCFEVTPDGEIVWSYVAALEINRCHRYPLSSIPADALQS